MEVNLNIRVYDWGIDNYKIYAEDEDNGEIICEFNENRSVQEALERVAEYLKENGII